MLFFQIMPLFLELCSLNDPIIIKYANYASSAAWHKLWQFVQIMPKIMLA